MRVTGRHPTRIRAALWAVAVWSTLLLTGCGSTGALSVTVDLTLYTEERWSADIDILFASQQMEFAGAQTDAAIMTMLEGWRAQGAQASSSRSERDNGNVSYRLHVSGQGLDQLNAALFDQQADLSVDASTEPATITFRYAPIGSVLGVALTRRFSLTGAAILDSNGIQSSERTVTWSNPTEVMEARLAPAAWVAWPIWVTVGAGGLVGVGVGVWLWRALAKTTCPECGARIPRRAVFCPVCGLERGC